MSPLNQPRTPNEAVQREQERIAALAVRQQAASEALRGFRAATIERRRARMVAHPEGGEPVDITEDVVSIMDRLTSTLDWGSGFFDDEDLVAFFRLADLLKIDVSASVGRP